MALPPAAADDTDAQPWDAYAVVLALGGSRRVAQHCGLAQHSIFSWYARGIPHHRIQQLHQMALQRRKPSVTLEVLQSCAAPRGPSYIRKARKAHG